MYQYFLGFLAIKYRKFVECFLELQKILKLVREFSVLELPFSSRNYKHIEDQLRLKISTFKSHAKDTTHFLRGAATRNCYW